MILNAFIIGKPKLWLPPKLLLMMKLTTLLLVLGLMQVNAASFAQKLTMKQGKASLREIFDQINLQTGYDVVIKSEDLQHTKSIAVNFKDQEVLDILKKILPKQNLAYTVTDNTIIIRPIVPPKTLFEKLMQQFQLINPKGKVVDSLGSPLIGASVAVKGTNRVVRTNESGDFYIQDVDDKAVLVISYLGYETREVKVSSDMGILRLNIVSSKLEEIQVMVSTGYQTIPKERSTGSFDYIDNQLINRSTSTNFLTRLENLSPGLLFNHGDAAATDQFLIRGRSTINGQAQPLIIVDDFPYDGDLNNINPNDIASVSILKDAAAASIWGARSGNGVIVITTKKGKSTKPNLQFVSNITITPRPNLYNINQMSPSDRVGLDRFLFENGRYSAATNPTTIGNKTTPIPDAVELLIKNPADIDAQLAQLGNHNVLDDLSKYFYQTAINQQYNVNVSGKQGKIQYYMSGGLDKNIPELTGQTYNRISLRSSNTYQVTKRLSIDATINVYNIEERRGNNEGVNTSATAQYNFLPYTQLTNSNGNALPVYMGLRKGFIDTVGKGRLLDWNYRPIDEIANEVHTVKTKDYTVNIGGKYTIMDGLDFLIKYQYENQLKQSEDLFTEQSYYARNNINDYTQINLSTGAISYPFPKGAILWRNNTTTTSHQSRAQLSLNRSFANKHEIAAIAGLEVKKMLSSYEYYQNLGYNTETGTITNSINTDTYFPRISVSTSSRISTNDSKNEFRDNFVSFFANVAYTFDKRYTVTSSLRKDEANLFGLNANQKGTPLWSVGGAWQIYNESFYKLTWLPYLKLRMAYGVNGNIARNASAVTTIATSTGGFTHPLQTAYILSLPNVNLSWERVKQLNIGIDFSTKNNRISGTVEYYNKSATNLLAQSPVDPTYGVSSMYLNVADMQGKGIDVQLNSVNLDGTLKWQTNFTYSHNSSQVTNYLMPTATTGLPYLPISVANPLIGRPLYSVFALPWKGLDPSTGDPIGLVNGQESKDYNAIYNNTPLEGLVFMGVAQPTNFGAIRNTFTYKNLDFSFNISYKLGYYFRRASVNYTNMYSGDWRGHSDYGLRWQSPGDEMKTNVPSRIYPADPNRDNFYQYSEILVTKGDHIRFEDINVGYKINSWKGISSVRFFAYVSNLGILWKANKFDIDPYYNNLPLQRASFSLGINANF